MKKIKITKANYWYKYFLGSEFTVIEEDEDDYIVGKLDDTTFFVNKNDCEFVTELTKDII
jgi:hypothetical protein